MQPSNLNRTHFLSRGTNKKKLEQKITVLRSRDIDNKKDNKITGLENDPDMKMSIIPLTQPAVGVGSSCY